MDMKPKGIIKRVFDFAVAELERRSRPPPAYGEEDGQPSASDAAPLDQQTTERIRPEEREPSSFATRVPSEEREKSVRPILGGLHLARSERGALKVRWSIASDELHRSAALIDDGAVLCLRLVSFAAGRDHVVREVQDRPSIQSQGECEIARPEGRAVVSLGLRAGGRFVSIAHHVAP
jgi:hypothetical protein